MKNSRVSVLQAVRLAQTDGKRLGIEPHHLAEKRRGEAVIAGDFTRAKVWRDVLVNLRMQKYLQAAGTK